MSKKINRLVSLIIAGALVAISSGCSQAVDLTSYQLQVVTWDECDEDLLKKDLQSEVFQSSTVECSSMLVPAVYSGFDKGKDFKIQMMRLHNAKPEDFKGSIFINPGGPGGSGLEQLQYSEFPEELLAHYDIIGFDPRGVGASDFSDGSEIKCSDTIDYKTYFEGEGSPANFDEFMENLPAIDNYFTDCTNNNPLWWTLSTDHVVDDLELMRAVVTGDADLNFIGTSYGTTIAGMYVTKYPRHVGKIVLDSPTTVDSDVVASDVEDAKGNEKKLTVYLTGYAEHAGITFDEAWQRLLEMRQAADDDELIGYAGFIESEKYPGYLLSSEPLLTRGILALNYMPEATAISYFNKAMDDLYEYGWNGNFEFLALNLDGYDANELDGKTLAEKTLVRSNAYEVMTIVNSMDYSPESMSEEDQKEMAQQIKAAAPMWTRLHSDATGYEYFGPSLGTSWDKIARDDWLIPDPPRTPLERSNTSGKELLIIGSLYESVTPFAFAKDTATLLKSPLISVESDVHGPAAGYDNACLNKVLFDYFVSGSKIESQTCSKN
jgi:pimeloyl-ACP methyl ester carboxylesterase